MKFQVDSNELKEALESLQVKGKQLTNTGFSSGSFGSVFTANLVDNQLLLANGDSTFMLKIALEVVTEGHESGTCNADASLILPYLKSFDGNVTITVGDYILISNGRKNANIPKLVNHPHEEALSRLIEMTNHIRYEPQPNTLFTFSNLNFEGSFSLNQKDFQNCLRNCELVGEGIYNLNYHQGEVTISSSANATNAYSETLVPVFVNGESATLDFSSPLYSFFKKDQLLNFYVRDEFPMMVVANDRMLMKAPHVGGN